MGCMHLHKRILMIAGPNGAGKTTTALSVLKQHLDVYEFINADEIARGLAPLHPSSMNLMAGKLMIKRLRDLLFAEKSFAFETTAAGINYLKYIKQAKQVGYEFRLMFLWLSDADLAVKRVAQRVSQGGHHIPENDIRRRYVQGIQYLMKHYLPQADSALILDNSDANSQKLIAEKNAQDGLVVQDQKIWEILEKVAYHHG